MGTIFPESTRGRMSFLKSGIAEARCSAVRNLLGGEMLANMSRTPAIIADAALFILSKEKLQYTGKTFIDEDVLAAEGITDLAHYSVVPGAKLFYDLFL